MWCDCVFFKNRLHLLPGLRQRAYIVLVRHHGVVFGHHIHAGIIIDGAHRVHNRFNVRPRDVMTVGNVQPVRPVMKLPDA